MERPVDSIRPTGRRHAGGGRIGGRRIARLGAASLCLATVAAGAGLGASEVAAGTGAGTNAVASPNIIMILADDLGYDQVSLNGGPIATPNINRIAEAGVRFTDGYVAAPVCTPSRQAVLTGRHPSRHGGDSNWSARHRPERLPSPTIGNLLKQRGYTTKAVGKWDLSGPPAGWGGADVTMPHQAGFDRFYGTLRGMENYCAGQGSVWRHTGNGVYDRFSNTKYMTHQYTDNATRFVRNHADDTNPFFLYLSYTAPHAPIQTPATCPGKDVSAATYRDMVQIMDNGIGRVLDALGPAAENTMVVFVADHGSQHAEFFPSQLRGKKYTLFEGGVRVPFTMSWPAGLGGAPAAYPQLVSTLDLLPTVAAATGAAATGYPGKDLVSYLNGSSTGSPHQTLRWRYVEDRKRPSQGTVKLAVRSGDYKYLRHIGVDGGTSEFLFDLSRDVGERNNLATDPAYAAVRDDLVAKHNAWNRYNRLLEGFEDPRPSKQPRAGKIDGFIGYGGTWTVVDRGSDHELRGVSDGLSGRVMMPGTHYHNVRAAVRIQLAEYGQAGMIVRGTSAATGTYPLTGYVVRLISPGDPDKPERIVLTRTVNGAGTVVRSVRHNIEPGVRYRLQVEVTGGTVTVSLDGVTQFAWTDATPIRGGGIGLRVVAGTAYFDGLSARRTG